MQLDDVQNKWSDAYHDILNELYEEATPGISYESLTAEQVEETDPPLYLRHFLAADRQEEIIEDVCSSYGIPEELYFNAKKAVFLSCGPSTSLDTVDRARKDRGLKPVSQMLE